MQSLGYRHLGAYLAGEGDLEGAIRRIKSDTRRYAKRQMTWFAAEREILWLAPDEFDAVSERIDHFLDR
jgi:tRNA dimethylallyltransferase